MIHSTKFRPAHRTSPGVAAVELAICLPLVILLLMGVWEVGRMLEAQNLLSNAAREGGRQASTGLKDEEDIETAVVNYLVKNGIAGATADDVTVVNLTSAAARPWTPCSSTASASRSPCP